MGSDAFSTPILQALLENGPSLSLPVVVVGVVTQPDRAAGRGRRVSEGPVKALGLEWHQPILQSERLRDSSAAEEVEKLRPDVIVVASFGQILPRRLLDAPRLGAVNLHPSLLPRYRGSSPVAGAILAGDQDTGTTLMLMTPRMDAGPILAQERTPIDPTETRGELDERLAHLSARLLMDCLPAWVKGELAPQPQDESRATYTARLTKVDAQLDWNRPATELTRAVRAYNPWPMAHTSWEGKQLRVLRARIASGTAPPGQVVGLEQGALAIGAGRDLFLVEHLQLEGARPLDASDFVRGRPAVLGALLGT